MVIMIMNSGHDMTPGSRSDLTYDAGPTRDLLAGEAFARPSRGQTTLCVVSGPASRVNDRTDGLLRRAHAVEQTTRAYNALRSPRKESLTYKKRVDQTRALRALESRSKISDLLPREEDLLELRKEQRVWPKKRPEQDARRVCTSFAQRVQIQRKGLCVARASQIRVEC